MEKTNSYPEAVEKLLTYVMPEPVGLEEWPNYLTLGITKEHIPDLLRMIADLEFRTTDPDDENPKYWAAVHAWRAVAQLRDVLAIAPLLQHAAGLLDDESGVTEWATEELPDVYEAIGPTALPSLISYIAEPVQTVDAHVNAITGLSKIGIRYPETREEAIIFLSRQLEQHTQNDPELNAFLIIALQDLNAIETLSIIKEAFDDEAVDEFMVSLRDVEVAFGLKEYPTNPFFTLPDAQQSPLQAPTAGKTIYTNTVPTSKAAKNKDTKKSKAKMAKASRKQNRKS